MTQHPRHAAEVKSEGQSTYAGAGVDIDAGARAKRRMAELAAGASRPEVLAGVGPFAGLFKLGDYRDPVLVASTDSVGTKVKLAALLDRYGTIGVDLVNHCVNDILTAGAEPLFFLDYIAGATLSEDQKVALVKGVATACRAAGCALLGGETADLPDVYAPGDFDLAGFIVGVVERDSIIDGSRIQEGDLLLGLPSSGLHTNGYSLVRKVFGVGVSPGRLASGEGGAQTGGRPADPDEERRRLDSNYPGLGVTLGEALMTPHRSYLHELRPLLAQGQGRGSRVGGRARDPRPRTRDPLVKGIAHITGGGLIDNVPRVLPEGLAARIERAAWRVPPLFTLIQRQGNIADEEMFRVFNMGLGMVLACDEEGASTVQRALREAKVVGRVVRQEGEERVEIVDTHS